MVVEDDANLREIYGVRLEAEGYEVVQAHDGEDALSKVLQDKPDLVLSDVMMPRISGFDMLDILRATPETANLKVIMLTALNDESQRTRGESLGADRYLVKSQTGIDDIIVTIKEVLAEAPHKQPIAPTSDASGGATIPTVQETLAASGAEGTAAPTEPANQ
jgi:DNA-binding response OmpR family regulator